MSDILLYAALKEKDKLNQEYLDLITDSGGATFDFSTNLGPADSQAFGGAESLCPEFVTAWKAQIGPVTVPRDNGFKVCDTSGYFRCGRCCAWTVPTGVTTVLFQMWGPGGSTSSNCCCGGSPFGVTGQYAALEVSVCPGEQFMLCSGCAYCCYAEQTTPGLCPSPTNICGCDFCVCQTPPCHSYCTWNADWLSAGGSVSCNLQVPNNDGCGLQSCDGWNFCWDTNSDDVDAPFIFGSYSTDVVCDGKTRVQQIYKIPVIWPRMYTPSSGLNNSFSVNGPVYGFENYTCCVKWTGNTCAGCCFSAQNGYQQIPAVGGYASTVFGGCNACGGDAGGMGMICVSWNCD